MESLLGPSLFLNRNQVFLISRCGVSCMQEGCLWFYMVLQKAKADPILTVELQSYKLEAIREEELSCRT